MKQINLINLQDWVDRIAGRLMPDADVIVSIVKENDNVVICTANIVDEASNVTATVKYDKISAVADSYYLNRDHSLVATPVKRVQCPGSYYIAVLLVARIQNALNS